MKTWVKVALFFGVVLLIALGLYVIFGSSGKNNAFQPQEEFRLKP